MVAPEVDPELIHLQFVAAWVAETVAAFLLQAAWCCAAVLLQARSPLDRNQISALEPADFCLVKGAHKHSKFKLFSCPPGSLRSYQRTMCILQQQRLALPKQQQELYELGFSKADPLFQALVSTPKPQAPNCWVPLFTPQAGDTAESGPATAPSEASTYGTGRSGAGGQSSSAASGSTSAQGSQHTSGQNSIGGGGGGQDDSDEDGNDKRRLAIQLAKSHSLETPDPLIAGTSTANIIQAAVDRARASGVTVAAAESAADRKPPAVVAAAASTSAPAAAATGPWRLASPFAAAAVSAPSTASAAGPSSSAQPAPRRMQSPFAAQAAAGEQRGSQAASASGSTSSSRLSAAPVSPFAAAQASSSAPAQQQAVAATGPWKLASPFAAVSASPAASVSPAASTAQKGRSRARTPKPGSPAAGYERSSGSPMQQSVSAARAYSPFAAAQPGGTSPFGSSSSSSSGSSGSRRAAAAAAASYAASRASQGASSSMGSRGPAAPAPWKLHSPFAAAPMPAFSATSTQLDAVAEEEPMDMEAARAAPVPVGSQSQLRPNQQAVDAVVAAAAAARQQQGIVSGASPTPSAASSGRSSFSKSRSPSPPAAQAGVSYSPRTSGSGTPARRSRQQAAGSSAPMQPVGPGGIWSPFAAAAAVAAATDAAFTPGSTPRASPTGSATGSNPQTTDSPKQGSRKGSSAGSSRPRQGASMAQSISLNTLMYPSALGSSVPSGSTEDRTITAGGSSGSVPTVGSKSRGASGSGQGSGSGGSLAAAAAAAAESSPAAAAGTSAPAAGPQQQPTVWRSPFAAVSAVPAQPAASAAPAARPAGAMAGSRPARAASGSRPQHVTFRSSVMPIAVSAGQAALMPPVLMAMPPSTQQMAAVNYQSVQTPVPLSSGAAVPAGRSAAAGAGIGAPAVLLPQYVMPTSAGLVSAAGLVSSSPVAGLVPVPVSVGMPAFFVHPNLMPLMQANRGQQSPAASIAAAPAVAMRMPAQRPAAASPFAAAQVRPPGSPFAAAQAAPASVTSIGSGSAQGMRPAAAVSASSAGFAAEDAPKLGCMCVAPACLAEGIPSQVQVYVLGLESRKAQPGPGHTYRVAAFMGSSLVAEATRDCKGGERLLRISLPALPKGVVQILVVDDSSKPCFMQHVLVLPPPCAQDLNSLWSELLRGQISTVPVSAPASAGASASTAAAASGSTHSSLGPAATGQLYSSKDSSSRGAASSSSSFTSVAGSGSVAATAYLPHRKLGPYEIQRLWDHSFSRVMTDIAAVLLTRSSSQELPAGVTSASTAARAAALRAPGQVGLTPRTSFDTAEMKHKVSTLLHFFATHSKWAVLELLTAHVYGFGASARAMHTSWVLPSASPAERAAEAAAGPSMSAQPGASTPAVPVAAVASAGPSASTGPGGSPVQQAAAPAQGHSEIQPAEPEVPLSSGSNSFSFQGVFSAAQQRSRSLAPASSGAATAQSGQSGDLAAGGSAAGSYQGRGTGERRVLKALRVTFKRAFSSKQ